MENRYVSSKDNEEFRKIAESPRRRVYVTSKLRFVSYDKAKDEWYELKQRPCNGTLRVSVLHRNRGVYREVWKAFYGEIPKGYKVVMLGEPKIENLVCIPKVKSAVDANCSKCRCDGIEYNSLKECAEAVGYSESHVQAMACGKRTNVIGVEYI